MNLFMYIEINNCHSKKNKWNAPVVGNVKITQKNFFNNKKTINDNKNKAYTDRSIQILLLLFFASLKSFEKKTSSFEIHVHPFTPSFNSLTEKHLTFWYFSLQNQCIQHKTYTGTTFWVLALCNSWLKKWQDQSLIWYFVDF